MRNLDIIVVKLPTSDQGPDILRFLTYYVHVTKCLDGTSPKAQRGLSDCPCFLALKRCQFQLKMGRGGAKMHQYFYEKKQVLKMSTIFRSQTVHVIYTLINNVCISAEYCDCWRTRYRYYPTSGWTQRNVDAIDFQTSGDVILQGLRLWGVTYSSTTVQVTIRLYHGSNLLAEKTGSYPTSYDKKTFKVFFPKQIKIHAGETYTATSKITTSSKTYYLSTFTTRFVCSGVTVTFLSSYKDRNGSSSYRGQIPTLIFRSLDC